MGDIMKKLRAQILITALLSLSYLPVMAQFVDIESPVKVSLRDVHFTDSQNGWAVGDSSTIINTIDGGLSWNIQQSPIGNLRLNRVQFLNEKVGYISAEKGVILSTQDGGTNWKSTIIDTMRDYKGLYFINADTGWIAGTGNWGNYVWGYSGQIQRTTDGGETWEKQYGSDTLVTYPIEDDWFEDIKFINSQVGYAVAGGILYSTTNSGDKWEKEGSVMQYLINIDVINIDTIWGCGDIFASTTDNGKTWFQNAVIGGYVYDLKMINSQYGYVLTSRLTEKKFMYTEDGGTTFNCIWEYEGPVLRSMFIETENNFICTVGDSGRITINKNFITDIMNNDLVKISVFTLHQNYPNPTNPNTIIKYQIPNNYLANIYPVKLIIFDILGNKLKTLVNKYHSPGIYEIEFDSSDFSSGVYIYTLSLGNFIQSKKMMVIK